MVIRIRNMVVRIMAIRILDEYVRGGHLSEHKGRCQQYRLS
jgi:hypothetical protein